MSKTVTASPKMKVLLLEDNANYRGAFGKVDKKTLEFLNMELYPCRNIKD